MNSLKEEYPLYQEIIEIIGTNNFLNLCEKIGGRYFRWPKLRSFRNLNRNELILQLVREGKTQQEIANIIGLSRPGISVFLLRLRRKLHAVSK